MKRILFMHQASTIGGGSYCLLNILREIDKSNIEPIACLASDGPLRMEIEKLGIEVVIFPKMAAVPYNRSLWSYSSVRAYWRVKQSISSFKQLLDDKKIDVVYLNNMMIYKYLKPAKECGCKTILHCREHWPLDEHLTQLQWARNAVYKYADELIAINNYSASIFPKKKATIVYDWIDMDSRYEKRSMDDIFGEDTSNLKIYLFTGGLLRIKGAYQVLYAFHTFINDSNSRLLFLGYDVSVSRQSPKYVLKLFLYMLGFDINEIKCLRLIKQDKRIVCMPSTYMITDIIKQSYCMLSYFTIPHANLALAESLILGIPVIAANTEESIEYSKGCLKNELFKINDINDFKSKLLMYNNDEAKHRVLQKSSLIKEMMSKEKNVEVLNAVLKSFTD